MPTSRPRAPLPPPLVSSVPGTWAYDTMSRRVRTDILARVFRENCFPAESQRRLLELDAELTDAGSVKLSRVRNDGGPDVDEWNGRILKEVIEKGETWLSAPWVVAEFYL